MSAEPFYGICHVARIVEYHDDDDRRVTNRERVGVTRDVYWWPGETAGTPVAWAVETLKRLGPCTEPAWATRAVGRRAMRERLKEVLGLSSKRGGHAADPAKPRWFEDIPDEMMRVGEREENGQEVLFWNFGETEVLLIGGAWTRDDVVAIAGDSWQPFQVLASPEGGPIEDYDERNTPRRWAYFDAVDDEMMWPSLDD